MISQKTLRRLYSSCLCMGENIAEFLRIVQINRKCKWIFLHQKENKVEIESTMSFCVERKDWRIVKDDAKKQNVDVNFSSITRTTMNIQHNLYCHYKRILAMKQSWKCKILWFLHREKNNSNCNPCCCILSHCKTLERYCPWRPLLEFPTRLWWCFADALVIIISQGEWFKMPPAEKVQKP
jgi:hypothetical protein